MATKRDNEIRRAYVGPRQYRGNEDSKAERRSKWVKEKMR